MTTPLISTIRPGRWPFCPSGMGLLSPQLAKRWQRLARAERTTESNGGGAQAASADELHVRADARLLGVVKQLELLLGRDQRLAARGARRRGRRDASAVA